ncbi:MAG: hypothetical protein ACP5JB_03965 [candidate division WOR-3 bacterium]|jgi:hypothetical protein
MKTPNHRHILHGVLRLLGLWAGLTGGYQTMGSTCPCCGRPGCPVGLGIAALFGLVGSALILKGKTILTGIGLRLNRKRNRGI